MSAITGIGDSLTIVRSASASFSRGTATRTMSAPASATLRICSMVAARLAVSVLVIVWTTTGAPPPIWTPPTVTCRWEAIPAQDRRAPGTVPAPSPLAYSLGTVCFPVPGRHGWYVRVPLSTLPVVVVARIFTWIVLRPILRRSTSADSRPWRLVTCTFLPLTTIVAFLNVIPLILRRVILKKRFDPQVVALVFSGWTPELGAGVGDATASLAVAEAVAV